MVAKEAKIEFLLDKTGKLYKKGLDCVLPNDPCCPCGHTGSDWITINGKPAGCSCGKCPRYRCLDCTATGRNEFCAAMSQLLMEDM